MLQVSGNLGWSAKRDGFHLVDDRETLKDLIF